MQDVCISFWKEDGSSDMMLKVTDICSTDPSDPTHCANPGDIKIDRAKGKVMEHLTSDPQGDQYPEKVWWFFAKCWADVSSSPSSQFVQFEISDMLRHAPNSTDHTSSTTNRV